jgi:tripartite-type tricarboxylate transporter receptor subunit TctC
VLAPNFPTVSDSGLSGYEAVATFGVFAPAQTPGSIINMLNRELVRYLTKTDVKEKFVTAGSEVVGSTSQELAAILRNDILKIGKLVKESGLRAD